MTAAERRETILAMFRHSDFVKITDIVSRFDVSNETARRDLDYLQDQQLIRRVYGGAILRERSATSVPVTPRSKLTRELSAIGKAAAELVGPGAVTAEGGMTGTYIRTIGKSGEAKLTVSTVQTEPVSLTFTIL